MTIETRLWLVAAIALVATFALGYALSHAAQIPRIDVEGAAIRGQATGLALFLTLTGRAIPLLTIALIGIAIAAITRTHVLAAVSIFVTQLISQGAVEGLKHLFARTRPDAWLGVRELGFSYPSGHATTAIVFYGSWLVLIALAPIERDLKLALCVLLALWIVGIDWSRMALGAHYPTDVLGGTLFGIACASALWAVLLRVEFAVK